MLKCCGRLIKPKRFTFTDDDGLKVVKVGFCANLKCGIPVIELENVNFFGRIQKQTLRGKKARNFLKENKEKFKKEQKFMQYRKNTAKGFHYCNTYWDLKQNKLKLEHRELATNRLIKRETLDLIEAS